MSEITQTEESTGADQETAATQGTESGKDSFTPINSQEELDRIFSKRLAREKKSLPADYETLKAKADKYDEMEDANKSELEKLRERAELAEAKANQLEASAQVEAWKREVSTETGIDVRVLHGSTLEEIQACAETLKEVYPQKPPQSAGVVKSESGKPVQTEAVDKVAYLRAKAKLPEKKE
jgi:hypothetical protein